MTAGKKRVLKWVLLSVLVVLLTSGFVAYRMYTKPHRNVLDTRGMAVTAEKLVTDYESDEAVANSIYLDQVLEVSGKITEITKNQQGEHIIVLDGTAMGTVRCTMEDKGKHDMATGALVSIKGICTGYLADVIMVRGVIPAE